jgi:hypothetical protein
MNDLKICLTLNGAQLCKPYTFNSIEEIDPQKVAKEVTDILEALKKQDHG